MDTSRRPGHGPIPQWQRSEAEELEICDRYTEGESAVQIAARKDVSPDMIYKILRMRGVSRRPGGHPLIECDGQKPCSSCGEVKFLHEYHQRGTGGRRGNCKVCSNAANRPKDNERKARVREALALSRSKQCPLCKRILPGSREYFRGSRVKFGLLDPVCKECIDEIARRSCRDGFDKPLTSAKITAVRMKMFTLQHYSGCLIPECACCGEKEFAFLSLDHINGGGNRHRKEIGAAGGYMFYVVLRRQGYPNGYQCLCFNCNSAKGYYGRCPHQKGTPAVASFIT